MSAPRHPDLHQWNSFICMALFALISLAVKAGTSPVYKNQELKWQQASPSHHQISKRATRSESLNHLRALLELKQRQPGQHHSPTLTSLRERHQLPLADFDPSATSVHDLVRLTDLFKSGKQDLSLLLSPNFDAAAEFASGDDAEVLPSYLASKGNHNNNNNDIQTRDSYADENSALYSMPYISSSSPELPSQLLKRLMPRQEVKRSYRNRWSRSRYGNTKRVLPCYLHVVTCY